MNPNRTQQAAATIWALWNAGETVLALPEMCRPQTENEGREIQLHYPDLSGSSVGGWKIAATSIGGQRHIGVSGPLEGPYLQSKMHFEDAVLSMSGNHMAVAEAEFAFKFGQDVPARDKPYSKAEIISAIESLHPSLEFPDSRLSDFASVGAATLLADFACGKDWVIGQATTEPWKEIVLAECPVKLIINGKVATSGTGADALGSPIIALEWVVNRLSQRGIDITADQYITTGVCGIPQPIHAGDSVTADLGTFGTVSATLVD